MPVDTSGHGRDKRARHGATSSETRQREAERRRALGELACAECSRLKLRCDKQIPCSACVRRGYASSCPNGWVLKPPETRPLNINQLHRKLADMSERIRQLEEALLINTPLAHRHPLLHPDLLATKNVASSATAPNPSEPPQDAFEDCLPGFGTLTISSSTSDVFIGRMGGAHAPLVPNIEPEGPLAHPLPHSTPEDSAEHNAPQQRIADVLSMLPPRDRGWALSETYLEHTTWHVRMVQREQIFTDLLAPIYTAKDADTPHAAHAQDLALLLMVFAAGALADPALARASAEAQAERFVEAARAVFDVQDAAASPSLAGVQFLVMLAMHHVATDEAACGAFVKRLLLEKTFSYLNFASGIGMTIGLHRDPGKFDLEEKVKQRRRQVNWQLFALQSWQSIATGRPVFYDLRYSDCQLPEDDEMTTGATGAQEIGSWRWRYDFVKTIMYDVNTMACQVGPVHYSDVLELDRKLHDISARMPGHLRPPPPDTLWSDTGPNAMMQRLIPTIWLDTTILLLHRNFFARAILKDPGDPLASAYAVSFWSTYRSACSLVHIMRAHFRACVGFSLRSWIVWKHVFSALIVIGVIVIRGPGLPIAPEALAELTSGASFFEAETASAAWSVHAMAVLDRLREKAVKTYTELRSASEEEQASLRGDCSPVYTLPRDSASRSGDRPPVERQLSGYESSAPSSEPSPPSHAHATAYVHVQHDSSPYPSSSSQGSPNPPSATHAAKLEPEYHTMIPPVYPHDIATDPHEPYPGLGGWDTGPMSEQRETVLVDPQDVQVLGALLGYSGAPQSVINSGPPTWPAYWQYAGVYADVGTEVDEGYLQV